MTSEAIPVVSVIMPCFNARAHLPASVGSVLGQSFDEWELIAVDDGSVDDTLAWLQTQGDPRIRAHSQPNAGVSAARNAGLSLARGRYIAFLDADDTWAPDFLEQSLKALEASPDAVLAYCGWQNVGLPGPRGQPFIPPDYEAPEKLRILFEGCRWPIHAALVRAEAVRRVGGFEAGLKNAEDYLLWLVIAGHAPIVRVPIVLAYYHFHSNGQASNNYARAALSHLEAQLLYLRRDREFARSIRRRGQRRLVYGALLQRGYERYWKRDLVAARVIFRRVMRGGYGRPVDWKYMLPCLLPLPWQFALMNWGERLQTPHRSGHN